MSDAFHNSSPSQPIPEWKKFTVTHTQLQAAALVNDIEIYSLLAKQIIRDVIVKTSVLFAGTGIASYTLSVGKTAALTKYVGASDVTTAVSATNFFRPASVLASGLESFGGATSIRASAIAVGANLDQSTGGSVDIWLLVETLP